MLDPFQAWFFVVVCFLVGHCLISLIELCIGLLVIVISRYYTIYYIYILYYIM